MLNTSGLAQEFEGWPGFFFARMEDRKARSITRLSLKNVNGNARKTVPPFTHAMLHY
jgi:hypothetical protein